MCWEQHGNRQNNDIKERCLRTSFVSANTKHLVIQALSVVSRAWHFEAMIHLTYFGHYPT